MFTIWSKVMMRRKLLADMEEDEKEHAENTETAVNAIQRRVLVSDAKGRIDCSFTGLRQFTLTKKEMNALVQTWRKLNKVNRDSQQGVVTQMHRIMARFCTSQPQLTKHFMRGYQQRNLVVDEENNYIFEMESTFSDACQCQAMKTTHPHQSSQHAEEARQRAVENSLYRHATCIVKVVDSIVSRLDGFNGIFKPRIDPHTIGVMHARYTSAAVSTAMWDKFGEILIDGIYSQDCVKAFPNGAHAWRQLVATLIEEIKQGYLRECRVIHRHERASPIRPLPSPLPQPNPIQSTLVHNRNYALNHNTRKQQNGPNGSGSIVNSSTKKAKGDRERKRKFRRRNGDLKMEATPAPVVDNHMFLENQHLTAARRKSLRLPIGNYHPSSFIADVLAAETESDEDNFDKLTDPFRGNIEEWCGRPDNENNPIDQVACFCCSTLQKRQMTNLLPYERCPMSLDNRSGVRQRDKLSYGWPHRECKTPLPI